MLGPRAYVELATAGSPGPCGPLEPAQVRRLPVLKQPPRKASEVAGIRTPDLRIKSPLQHPKNPGKTAISANVVANRAAVETKSAHDDPDLQAVIDAWPDLPATVKRDILAAVHGAR